MCIYTKKSVLKYLIYVHTHNLENSCKIRFCSSSLVIFEICGQNEGFNFFFQLNFYFSSRAILVTLFNFIFLLLEP